MLSANWWVALVTDGFVIWAVPVFVMISGAVFLRPEREVTYREILRKRVPRLLLVYAFWVVAYVLFVFARNGFEGFTLWRFVRRCIVSPYIHLWYLPMLAGVYLLIPVLRKIAADKKLMRYVLVVWVVYIFVSYFHFSKSFEQLDDFYMLFAANDIVGYSGYFLLGYYLSTRVFTKRQRVWIYIVGLAGVLAVIAGSCLYSCHLGCADELFFKKLSVLRIATAVAVFVAAQQLAPRCEKAIQRVSKWVQKDLFGIYVIHEMWLLSFGAGQLRFGLDEWIMLPLLSVAAFLLSLFSVKLIRMVPFLRKVVE